MSLHFIAAVHLIFLLHPSSNWSCVHVRVNASKFQVGLAHEWDNRKKYEPLEQDYVSEGLEGLGASDWERGAGCQSLRGLSHSSYQTPTAGACAPHRWTSVLAHWGEGRGWSCNSRVQPVFTQVPVKAPLSPHLDSQLAMCLLFVLRVGVHTDSFVVVLHTGCIVMGSWTQNHSSLGSFALGGEKCPHPKGQGFCYHEQSEEYPHGPCQKNSCGIFLVGLKV